MTARKKKIICITALLIIAAAAVVFCTNFFTDRKTDEYDGTLVNGYYELLTVQDDV